MSLLALSLLSSVALLGLFGFLAWKAVKPYLERHFKLREIPLQQAKPSETIPADVLGFTYSYGSEWARNQVLDRAYELYFQLGSWDHVRRALVLENQELSFAEVESSAPRAN